LLVFSFAAVGEMTACAVSKPYNYGCREWVLNKAGVKRELLDTVKARKL